MIDEIIGLYSKQLEMYNTLKETLEKVQNSDFNIIDYNLEFENADYLLNKIEKLNEKAEQLKLIYVSKHNLDNFSGAEIKKTESIENYNKLKKTIDSIAKMIASVKQIQDSVINRINAESNINKKLQSNSDKKNALNLYKSNAERK